MSKNSTSLNPLSLRIEEGTANKLKYIAWHDRKSNTDIYKQAFESLISEWEKKNGAITEDQLKEARIIK